MSSCIPENIGISKAYLSIHNLHMWMLYSSERKTHKTSLVKEEIKFYVFLWFFVDTSNNLLSRHNILVLDFFRQLRLTCTYDVATKLHFISEKLTSRSMSGKPVLDCSLSNTSSYFVSSYTINFAAKTLHLRYDKKKHRRNIFASSIVAWYGVPEKLRTIKGRKLRGMERKYLTPCRCFGEWFVSFPRAAIAKIARWGEKKVTPLGA